MCSPFSTAFWRKSLENYQSIGSTQSETHQESIRKDIVEFSFDKIAKAFEILHPQEKFSARRAEIA